jgi:hypothetical protein
VRAVKQHRLRKTAETRGVTVKRRYKEKGQDAAWKVEKRTPD